MICYYGKHYNAYFKRGGEWMVFDDVTVKKVNPSIYICLSIYLPLLSIFVKGMNREYSIHLVLSYI